MGYTRQAFIGFSWMSGFRMSTRAITFLRIIILARLLSPAQFGIFGIATLVLSFLEIVTETGINAFLIQEKKEIKEYINEAWFISIIRGITLFVLLIVFSSLVAAFFHAPDAGRIILALSLVPLIKGFINPAIVQYQKDLQFQKEFFLRFSVFLFDSAVVILLAFLTHDVVSFVYGFIAGAMLEVLLSFLLIRLRPKLVFRFGATKEILHRGKWITLFGVFNFLAQEGDNIVVGRLLGTGSLGIYQMGYKLSTLPISEISDVINKVIFPVYTQFSTDTARLMRAFVRTSTVVAAVVVVFGLFLLFLPKEVFIYLLGEQWSDVITILPILIVYGMLRAIIGSTASFFLSVKKQNQIAAMTFARLFVLAITIFPLITAYGIQGAAISALLSVVVEIPFVIFFVRKFVKNIS